MDPVRRVVIRDKHPLLERASVRRPWNRAVLAVAAVALVVQVAAIIQVAFGLGNSASLFEHALWAFVALFWLALGLFVFLQHGADAAGRLFLLCSAAGSIWQGLGTLSYAHATGHAAFLNAADAVLYSVGLLLFAPLLYSFTRAYTGIRVWGVKELALYLPAALTIGPVAHDFVAGPKSILWKIGIATIPAYLIAAIVYAARDMYAETDPERQAQLRALLFGLIAGTVPGIFTFGIPLLLYALPPVPTGWLPPLVLLFLIAMSYSVLLFEFSEADLIVRRGVVYGVLTMAIVAVYGLLGILLVASGASVLHPGGGLAFVAATVLIGSAFGPLRRTTRRLVDWLLYGQRMDRWTSLQMLSERLATVMQPDELGEVLSRQIATNLHLRGAFLLRRGASDLFTVRHVVTAPQVRVNLAAGAGTVSPSEMEMALGAQPAPLLLIHARPLTASRRQVVPESVRPLDALGVALAIPLTTRFGLEAVLCLQGKLSHDAIDADDIELLNPVIRQASAALDNALLFSRLEEKVDELRYAYMRIAREQESERARLARELHDGTAQELANLITLATVAERQMNGDGGPRATLDRLRRQAEDAYQGVRRASYALRPVMLDDFGLAPTLERYLDGVREATGVSIDFTPAAMPALPGDVELALFRVAQECMENVRKHSGASHVDVRVESDATEVRLVVQDNGAGMDPNAVRGIGLAGMRERVEAVGGTIDVRSEPGQGVRVEACVPARAA